MHHLSDQDLDLVFRQARSHNAWLEATVGEDLLRRVVVNATFFPGTMIKSNFLCNLGYGDAAKLDPRLPRPSFDEACQVV